eukprot:Opistho-2@23647
MDGVEISQRKVSQDASPTTFFTANGVNDEHYAPPAFALSKLDPALHPSRVNTPTGEAAVSHIKEDVASSVSEAIMGTEEAVGGVSEGWRHTLEKVVPAVVAIKVCSVRSFDTVAAGYSVATGFVVDAKRGIILTNRHVVTPGPVVSEATFYNHEEVPISPIYRDPVHDFGFYRFDTSKIKFMKVVDIALAPERARVGTEIRVIGNDAGEKLSILAGTLARVDREAPNYGSAHYNDFNTFYLQAASSTSGGSSGSPVVDIDGYAIAINAGGKRKAASSFYLPLDRVVRALRLIQAEEPVTRGTLQTIFRYLPYDEVRRLGMRSGTEAAFRLHFPLATGLLVVDQTVPKGTGDGPLQAGDILVRVQNRRVNSFVVLEALLDESVGQEIVFDIERGGEPRTSKIIVQDLHSIVPTSYLEMGGCVFHTLSYTVARNSSVPVGGVCVAHAGYMLSRSHVPKNSIVLSVNGIDTPTLDDFERVMVSYSDGARVTLRYVALGDRHREQAAVVTIDRRWHAMTRCILNPKTGLWDANPLADAPAALPIEPASTDFGGLCNCSAAAEVRGCSVTVTFDVPHCVSGIAGTNYTGYGLVVDAANGLVLVDRNTVPTTVGDVVISFGGSFEVPARPIFLHPVHNFAIVKYDPALVGDTPVQSAVFSETPLAQRDAVYLVGLTRNSQMVSRTSTVFKIEKMNVPPMSPPRFRATNVEVIHLDNTLQCIGGVLTDSVGRVQALWASYSYQSEGQNHECFRGLPIEIIADVIPSLSQNMEPTIRYLDIEMWPILVADARNQGLSGEWVKRIETACGYRRQVLTVRRLIARSQAQKLLKEGDMILSCNNTPVSAYRDVERIASTVDAVTLTILRNGKEMEVAVPTDRLSGRDITRVVHWAGTLVQEPHRSVAQQAPWPEGVYVSWWSCGSPAHKHELRATVFITEVNGVPTPDLDAFIAQVKALPCDAYARLKVVDLSTKTKVLTIKPDFHYWPTWELAREDGAEWKYKEY